MTRRVSSDLLKSMAMSDWFNKRFVEQQPVEAGLLDLSRFRNY